MKKTLQTLLLAATITSAANAQTADLSNCKKVCEKQVLVETGPFIGIRFNCNTAGIKNALIYEVIQNTAASRNNLQVNDVVIALDNVEVTSNTQLLNMVAAHKPGDKVNLTYKHLGQVLIKEITIGALKSEMVTVKECCEEVPALEVIAAANVTISPNPANNVLNITSGDFVKGEVLVTIMDLNGATIKSFKKNNEGTLNIPVSVEDMPNGAYIVKLKSSAVQHVQKFVVAH